MTTSSATKSSNRTAGVAALAVAGLLDIVTGVVALLGSREDEAPTPVLITLIVAGLVSFAALAASRGALIAAYVARLVSAALGIPALFLEAPVWVRIVVVLGLILSVTGIWLTAPALRRRP